jgi:hypothetical protein
VKQSQSYSYSRLGDTAIFIIICCTAVSSLLSSKLLLSSLSSSSFSPLFFTYHVFSSQGLARFWPWGCAAKQVLFLNELEEILELCRGDQLALVQDDLFKLLAACLSSPHFQVIVSILPLSIPCRVMLLYATLRCSYESPSVQSKRYRALSSAPYDTVRHNTVRHNAVLTELQSIVTHWRTVTSLTVFKSPSPCRLNLISQI